MNYSFALQLTDRLLEREVFPVHREDMGKTDLQGDRAAPEDQVLILAQVAQAVPQVLAENLDYLVLKVVLKEKPVTVQYLLVSLSRVAPLQTIVIQNLILIVLRVKIVTQNGDVLPGKIALLNLIVPLEKIVNL